jgi:hypothetical protein
MTRQASIENIEDLHALWLHPAINNRRNINLALIALFTRPERQRQTPALFSEENKFDPFN